MGDDEIPNGSQRAFKVPLRSNFKVLAREATYSQIPPLADTSHLGVPGLGARQMPAVRGILSQGQTREGEGAETKNLPTVEASICLF